MIGWLTLLAVALTSAAVTWSVTMLRVRSNVRAAAESEAKAIARAEEATSQFDDLADQATRQKRRADEFFGIIEGVEQEADTWRKMWKEGMQKAGVAQGWLLRDLDLALRRANVYANRLRQHGEKVEDEALDPKLGELLKELTDTRALPADRKVEAVKAAAAVQNADKADK